MLEKLTADRAGLNIVAGDQNQHAQNLGVFANDPSEILGLDQTTGLVQYASSSAITSDADNEAVPVTRPEIAPTPNDTATDIALSGQPTTDVPQKEKEQKQQPRKVPVERRQPGMEPGYVTPPIPYYNDDPSQVNLRGKEDQKEWEDFHWALRNQGMTPAEQNAAALTFSHEGGQKSDGTTVAGITDGAIEGLFYIADKEKGPSDKEIFLREGAKRINITPDTESKDLTIEQQAQFYKLRQDDVLYGPVTRDHDEQLKEYENLPEAAQKQIQKPKRPRSTLYFDQIKNDTVAAAFMDTMYREGSDAGGKIIQRTLNQLNRQQDGKNKDLSVDGIVGSGTFNRLKHLTDTEEGQKHFLNILQQQRIQKQKEINSKTKDPKKWRNIPGESKRIRFYDY